MAGWWATDYVFKSVIITLKNLIDNLFTMQV